MDLISFRREKPKVTRHLDESVKADLEKVVYELKAGDYADALQRVESILQKEPNIPIAAFLRSLILWEGYGDSSKSRMGLKRVMELVPKKNHDLHYMASQLLEEIDHEISKLSY
jgi:hypothetical protein